MNPTNPPLQEPHGPPKMVSAVHLESLIPSIRSNFLPPQISRDAIHLSDGIRSLRQQISQLFVPPWKSDGAQLEITLPVAFAAIFTAARPGGMTRSTVFPTVFLTIPDDVVTLAYFTFTIQAGTYFSGGVHSIHI